MPSSPPSPAAETPGTEPRSVFLPVLSSIRVIVPSSRSASSSPPPDSGARPQGVLRFAATVRTTRTDPVAGGCARPSPGSRRAPVPYCSRRRSRRPACHRRRRSSPPPAAARTRPTRLSQLDVARSRSLRRGALFLSYTARAPDGSMPPRSGSWRSRAEGGAIRAQSHEPWAAGRTATSERSSALRRSPGAAAFSVTHAPAWRPVPAPRDGPVPGPRPAPPGRG